FAGSGREMRSGFETDATVRLGDKTAPIKASGAATKSAERYAIHVKRHAKNVQVADPLGLGCKLTGLWVEGDLSGGKAAGGTTGALELGGQLGCADHSWKVAFELVEEGGKIADLG